MFRRSKKKAPPSRARSYVIPPEDFTAEQDLHHAYFLKYGLNSPGPPRLSELTGPSGLPGPSRPSVDALSVSSVNSSETSASDDTATSYRAKSKSLTFSTFLGTPRMSRKDSCPTEYAIHGGKPGNEDKDASSISLKDEGTVQEDKQQGKPRLEELGPPPKKASMISRVKQALSTPRMKRKEHRSAMDTSGCPTSKPPPLPTRISSLTRNEERPGAKKKEGKSSEKKTSKSKRGKLQTDTLCNDPEPTPQVSVDVETIVFTMSEIIDYPELEKCETLKSVDYLSDDEASESISSSTCSVRRKLPHQEATAIKSSIVSSSGSYTTNCESQQSSDSEQSQTSKCKYHGIDDHARRRQNFLCSAEINQKRIDFGANDPEMSQNSVLATQPTCGDHCSEEEQGSSTGIPQQCLSNGLPEEDTTCGGDTKESLSDRAHHALVRGQHSPVRAHHSPVAPPRRKRASKPSQTQGTSLDITPDINLSKSNCNSVQESTQGHYLKSMSCTSLRVSEAINPETAKMRKQHSAASIAAAGRSGRLSNRPPLGPKPQWLKHSKKLATGNPDMEYQSLSVDSGVITSSISLTIPPGHASQHEGKDLSTAPDTSSSSAELLQRLDSDSDTQSSSISGAELRTSTQGPHEEAHCNIPPQGANASNTKEEWSGSGNRVVSIGARASTPTMELYQNAGCLQSMNRSVPSPRTGLDWQQDILVMDDDGETSCVLSPGSKLRSIDMPSDQGFTQQPHTPARTSHGPSWQSRESVDFIPEGLIQQQQSAGSTQSGCVQPQQQHSTSADHVNPEDISQCYQEQTHRDGVYRHSPRLAKPVPLGPLQPNLSSPSRELHSRQGLDPSCLPQLHHTRPQHPLPCRLDTDIDISKEIMSPNFRSRSVDCLSLPHRSFTPTIEQMRNLQRDQYAQNDIVVDNLRYRPSTPLIGGAVQARREAMGSDRLTFRSSTPVLFAPSRDINGNLNSARLVCNHRGADFVTLRESASRSRSVDLLHQHHPVLPKRSNPNDIYSEPFKKFSEQRVLGREPALGSFPTLHSGSAGRPPSPDLHTKVNSVLDRLISRPFTAGQNRQTHPVNHHGHMTLSPRSVIKPLTPRSVLPRPYSNFQTDGVTESNVNRSQPEHSYDSQDMERSICHPDLRGFMSVPPLNLNLSADLDPSLLETSARSTRASRLSLLCYGLGVAPLDGSAMLPPFRTGGESLSESLPQSGLPHHHDVERPLRNGNRTGREDQEDRVQHSFHGHMNSGETAAESYLSQPSHEPEHLQNDEDTEHDSTPDISTACLELSNQDSLNMTSDEDADDTDTESDSNHAKENPWASKLPESWGSRDVRGWCISKGFHQVAEVLDEKDVTGEQLVDLQESDLVKSGIHEETVRREFLEELHQLKLKPRSAASLWRLKQRRQTDQLLGVPEEEVSRVGLLDRRMSTSAESLLRAAAPRRPAGSRHTSSAGDLIEARNPNNLYQVQVPLIKWRTEEVVAWLRASHLDRFITTFEERCVTGQDLAGISMQLLDDLQISSLEDREVLLSQLYDLQHPQGPSLDALTTSPAANQKPASSALLSCPPRHQSEADGVSPTSDPMEMSGHCGIVSTGCGPLGGGGPAAGAGPARNTSFQGRLRDIMSPWRQHGRQKDSDTICVWHDFTGSAQSTNMAITEATTSRDVVQTILEDLELPDDANLYCLAEVTAASTSEKVVTRELGRFECPLALQRQWSAASTARFELHRRLGITIKVICQVSNMKPRGKVFRVSPQTNCGEALRVALRKFGLSHVDPALFCLLPVHKDTGDVRLMEDVEIIQDCETDAFVLSNQGNADQLLARTDTLPLLQHEHMVLRRNSSLNSHGSSALSQSSEASLGSDTPKPRFEKLESLEAQKRVPSQMADIEASLAASLNEDDIPEDAGSMPPTATSFTQARPPSGRQSNYNGHSDYNIAHMPGHAKTSRYVTPRKQKLPSSNGYATSDVQSDDHLELLREIALMRESIQERDATILTIQKENQQLNLQAKQIKELQAKLVEVTSHQEEQERQWQRRLEEARGTQTLAAPKVCDHDDDSDSGHETNRSTRGSTKVNSDLSSQVEHLEKELWATQGEMSVTEEELSRLRLHQQAAAQETGTGKSQADLQVLAGHCSVTETKLITLKQKHAHIYAQLELTRKEHNKQQARAGPCLYESLSPGAPQCVLCVELVSSEGPGFISGRDTQDRIIIKHVADGLPLRKGDRLLEVNGHRVLHLSDPELLQILKQSKVPTKMVILRDIHTSPSQSSDLTEDLCSMKDDLALAMLEVESTQEENQDLLAEVARFKQANSKLKEEKEELSAETERLHHQMESCETQWCELQQLLGQMKESDIDIQKVKAIQEQMSRDTHSFSRPTTSARKKLRFGDDFQMDLTGNASPNLTNGSGNGEVIAYDLLDERLPLWESLRSAPKREVLQVLKDHILETQQQKSYLDRLLSVVVDEAPQLLGQVDEAIGLENTVCWKPHSEEFC